MRREQALKHLALRPMTTLRAEFHRNFIRVRTAALAGFTE
jgi:hypothetical protein